MRLCISYCLGSIYLWMQLVKMSTLIILSTNLLVGKAPSQHLPYLTTFHLSEFSSPPFPHGHKKMGWHIRLADVAFVFLEDAPFKGDPERLAFCHEPTAFGITGQCPPSNPVNLRLEEQMFTPKTKKEKHEKRQPIVSWKKSCFNVFLALWTCCFTEKAHG